MPHRLPQINELIRDHLSRLLLTEVDWPEDLLVTVLRVETAKDLRHAKVWVSVLPFEKTSKALNLLRRKAGLLQFELNKKLTFKPLPRINFTADATEQKASGIEELLNRLRQEQNQ